MGARLPPPASSSGGLASLFSTVKTAEKIRAQQLKKIRAQQLRREGLSVRAIERRLGIARSTVSLWVREIELSDRQQAEIALRGASARSRARSAYYRARRRRFQEEGRVLAKGLSRLEGPAR